MTQHNKEVIRRMFEESYPDYADMENPTADTTQDARAAWNVWQAAIAAMGGACSDTDQSRRPLPDSTPPFSYIDYRELAENYPTILRNEISKMKAAVVIMEEGLLDKGDASARKDEAAAIIADQSSSPASDIPCEISDNYTLAKIAAEAVLRFENAQGCVGKSSTLDVCKIAVESLRPYLRTIEPVSLKDGAEAVKAIFDLSLIGPDSGFKPHDVAQAIAERWGVKYVN